MVSRPSPGVHVMISPSWMVRVAKRPRPAVSMVLVLTTERFRKNGRSSRAVSSDSRSRIPSSSSLRGSSVVVLAKRSACFVVNTELIRASSSSASLFAIDGRSARSVVVEMVRLLLMVVVLDIVRGTPKAEQWLMVTTAATIYVTHRSTVERAVCLVHSVIVLCLFYFYFAFSFFE